MTDPTHADIDATDTPKEIWYSSDQTRLFAVELGGGHPILFLHGGLADHRACLLRLRPLAESFRIITPDVRGSGRSLHAGALSWDQLADDVAALMDHLGLDRAVVGGISAGSGAALRFALRHPARMVGLVLVSPVYAGAQRGPTEPQRAAKRAMQELGQRAVSEGIQVLYPLYEQLPPTIRELALEMASGFDAPSVAATTRFLASGSEPFDVVTELASIAVPTLLVPGNDPEHPPEVAALYADHIPERVVTQASIGEVGALVEGFCRRLPWTTDG
jgi:3-oxoadipate enol-lactonase